MHPLSNGLTNIDPMPDSSQGSPVLIAKGIHDNAIGCGRITRVSIKNRILPLNANRFGAKFNKNIE